MAHRDFELVKADEVQGARISAATRQPPDKLLRSEKVKRDGSGRAKNIIITIDVFKICYPCNS